MRRYLIAGLVLTMALGLTCFTGAEPLSAGASGETGGVRDPLTLPYTFEDAENALAMSVGLIPVNSSYDVTGEEPNSGPDGKVTARDAQVIAKLAARGLRGAPTPAPSPPPGPEPVVAVIPDLVGKAGEEAKALLEKSNWKCQLKAGSRQPNFDDQAGTVYTQSPQAGSKVSAGETVLLIVYGKRQAQPAPAVFPNLIGKAKDEIEDVLAGRNIQLQLGEGNRQPPSDSDAGHAYAQSPQPGTPASPGQVLFVIVYPPSRQQAPIEQPAPPVQRRSVPPVDPPARDSLAGIWVENGQWQWQLTPADASYSVKGLTNLHEGNHATMLSFDGTLATFEFWDNGYHGTLAWKPADANSNNGNVVFKEVPSDSPQPIGQEIPCTMLRSQRSQEPGPNAPPPDTAEHTVNFDSVKPGAETGADALAAARIRIAPGPGGKSSVYAANPAMALPKGLKQVLQVVQDKDASQLTLTFQQPLSQFGLTRIGVVNGASLPKWHMKAVDSGGATVDSTGEDNWGFDANPRQFSVKGAGIVQIEIDVDNHWNGSTFATYSSLPIAEIRWMLDQRAQPIQPGAAPGEHSPRPTGGGEHPAPTSQANPAKIFRFTWNKDDASNGYVRISWQATGDKTATVAYLFTEDQKRALQLGNVPAFTAKLEREAWVIRGPEFDKFLADFFRALGANQDELDSLKDVEFKARFEGKNLILRDNKGGADIVAPPD